MNIDHIYLDLHGVLADFVGGVCKLYKRDYNDVLDAWPKGDYDGLYLALGTTEEELWARISARKGFWANLAPYPWTEDLYRECAAIAPVTILTAPGPDPDCEPGTRAWVDENLPGGVGVQFCPAHKKHEFATHGRLLVDDRNSNVEEWKRSGGEALLFPQHWNALSSWDEDPVSWIKVRLFLYGQPNVFPKRICGFSTALGRKDDDGKLRYDLIPVAPLREVAKVYTMGAKKYEDRNWEKGLKWGRVYAALQRHAQAWWGGETNCPKDGQHHLSSVVWAAFALMEFERTHPELDDRKCCESGQ